MCEVRKSTSLSRFFFNEIVDFLYGQNRQFCFDFMSSFLFQDVFKLVGGFCIDDPSGVWMTSVCLYVQSSLSFLHLIMEQRIDCVFLNAFMHWAETIRPDV